MMKVFRRAFFVPLFALLSLVSVAVYAATGSVTYVYDDIGQLVEMVYDDGTTITYTYDAVGNRETTVTTPGQ
jgi:YD repeat-containing protein